MYDIEDSIFEILTILLVVCLLMLLSSAFIAFIGHPFLAAAIFKYAIVSLFATFIAFVIFALITI